MGEARALPLGALRAGQLSLNWAGLGMNTAQLLPKPDLTLWRPEETH